MRLGLMKISSASSASMEGANGIQKSRFLIMSLMVRTTSVRAGLPKIERLPKRARRIPCGL